MSKFIFVCEKEAIPFDDCISSKKTVEFSTYNLYDIISEFQIFLRGCGYCFDGQLEIVDDEEMAYSIAYDGEEIDNWGASTDGKSSDFYFYLVEDGEIVENYSEPVSDYVNYWPEDYEKTKTFKFTKKTQPPMPGDYKCTWSPGFGTSYGTLEWTGDKWLEYEYDKPKEVTGVKTWAGLNWDTSDMKNKPKRKPSKPKTGVYPYPSQAVLKAQEETTDV